MSRLRLLWRRRRAGEWFWIEDWDTQKGRSNKDTSRRLSILSPQILMSTELSLTRSCVIGWKGVFTRMDDQKSISQLSAYYWLTWIAFTATVVNSPCHRGENCLIEIARQSDCRCRLTVTRPAEEGIVNSIRLWEYRWWVYHHPFSSSASLLISVFGSDKASVQWRQYRWLMKLWRLKRKDGVLLRLWLPKGS